MAGGAGKCHGSLEMAQSFIELPHEIQRGAEESRAQHARVDGPAEALALELAGKLLDHAERDIGAALQVAERMMRLHQPAARSQAQPELLVLLGHHQRALGALTCSLVLTGYPQRRRNLAVDCGEAPPIADGRSDRLGLEERAENPLVLA